MADPSLPVIRPRVRCAVCRDPRKNEIHALRASKMTLTEMEAVLRRGGKSIKRETLGKHFAICLGGRTPTIDDDALVASITAGGGAATDPERDFAALVRTRATALLEAGAMKVTASHGLAAQALLDRRVEKEADRNLALNMARLLSGAISLPPVDVIEMRQVGPPADLPLLAPPDIVEAR